MKGRVSLKFLLMLFALVLFSWSTCYAGPGTVEVQTIGGITVRLGGQIRIIPTSEINRDFGLSNQLGRSEDARAAQAMAKLGNLSATPNSYDIYKSNTRAHLNEGAGAVKDDYIRTENRLFFNFARKNQWSVYMALEMDSLFDRGVADRTDFAKGDQSQQFGIERLLGTINLPWIYSQLEAGWDVRGIDVGYGGLVYGDDDPGIGIVGSKNGFDWAFWYIKKDENEAGYALGTSNPLGSAFSGKDEDRTFYYAKAGYKLGNSYIQGFYFLDRNYIPFEVTDNVTKISRDITRNFIGLNYKGSYGIIKPMAEIVYCIGDYNYDFNKTGSTDKDIRSFAAFADVALDLHKYVSLNSFEVHVGGYYLEGDANQNDNKLNGYAPAVGITRFTPRFGSEQSISFDGNPILGQTLYSMFPSYFGTSGGASINGKGSMDNPGFCMLGGGIKASYGKWYYNTHIMAMWFNQSKAVENYFKQNKYVSNARIHSFMGIEWNNELCYRIYQNVTIKGGAAFLFPGHGAKDITKALDAYGKYGAEADFNKGKAADDVSMRFAAELLWFF